MTKQRYNKFFLYLAFFCSTFSCGIASADNLSDMQNKLNQEVLAKPFSVESEANLNAALNAATERGKPTQINPVPTSGQGIFGNYYQPYYGYGYGYGFGYSRPYYNYRPYYSGYW
jgi:hypothetical protein